MSTNKINQDNSLKKILQKLSLQAQALFGLRIEESLKIQPHIADCGDTLYLKSTWTKGGRARYIPIRTTEQRQWLEQAKAMMQSKQQSLIPLDKDYITYRRATDQYLRRQELSGTHGLRHHYAQQRYKKLTGWPCLAKCGPIRQQLSSEQSQIDKAARLQISKELRHSRLEIVATYLLGLILDEN